MKQDKGFIQLNRLEIQESKLYPTSRKFTKYEAFLDLLMLAAHSDISFIKKGIEIKLKRGQVGYSFVGLSDRWKWDRKTVSNFVNNYLKKYESVDSEPYPERNPVTTIITINLYDYYIRKSEKTDTETVTETGTKKDGKTDTFNNYKNSDNSEKYNNLNDNDNDALKNPGNNKDSQSKNFKRKLSVKEEGLIDDFISWAYDTENKFNIEKPIEETREQIENTVRKYGYEKISSIFNECSLEREAWDYSEENPSAYVEFWERVKYLKYANGKLKEKDIIKKVSDNVNFVNGVTKKNFSKDNCRNLKELILNNISNNDIGIFTMWFVKDIGFKENPSVLDNVTLDDIFSKENWNKFLSKSKRRGVN